MANMYGGQFNKALVISNYQEDGHPVFYVRPFSEETKKDLERLKYDAPRASATTTVTEKDGTYRIASDEKIDALDFMTSFWGMLFRRFLSESKAVCVDPITEEKFYGVIFSHEFIKPCARKLAA